jgi:hypothetical protein
VNTRKINIVHLKRKGKRKILPYEGYPACVILQLR